MRGMRGISRQGGGKQTRVWVNVSHVFLVVCLTIPRLGRRRVRNVRLANIQRLRVVSIVTTVFETRTLRRVLPNARRVILVRHLDRINSHVYRVMPGQWEASTVMSP